MTITDNLVEIAARAIAARKMGLVKDPDGSKLPDDLWRQAVPDARAALFAVAPEIIETCAKVAEPVGAKPSLEWNWKSSFDFEVCEAEWETRKEVAKSIRALSPIEEAGNG